MKNYLQKAANVWMFTTIKIMQYLNIVANAKKRTTWWINNKFTATPCTLMEAKQTKNDSINLQREI